MIIVEKCPRFYSDICLHFYYITREYATFFICFNFVESEIPYVDLPMHAGDTYVEIFPKRLEKCVRYSLHAHVTDNVNR